MLNVTKEIKKLAFIGACLCMPLVAWSQGPLAPTPSSVGDFPTPVVGETGKDSGEGTKKECETEEIIQQPGKSQAATQRKVQAAAKKENASSNQSNDSSPQKSTTQQNVSPQEDNTVLPFSFLFQIIYRFSFTSVYDDHQAVRPQLPNSKEMLRHSLNPNWEKSTSSLSLVY